jgi:hypothetical protein
MRTVLLPHPSPSRKIELRGPSGRRRCRSGAGAEKAFRRALHRAGQEDRELHDGWSLWWSDRAHVEDSRIVVWVWPEDDNGGDRSADLIRRVFQDAGFEVRRDARPSLPPSLHTQALVVREGDGLVGSALFRDLRYCQSSEARAPSIIRVFDHAPQVCPHCEEHVQPRRALWGMPSSRLSLRLSLGEVEAMGCLVEPGDACCPKCGRAFFGAM